MFGTIGAVIDERFKGVAYYEQQKAHILYYFLLTALMLVAVISLAMFLFVDAGFLVSRNVMRVGLVVLIGIGILILRSGRYLPSALLVVWGSATVVGVQVIVAAITDPTELAVKLYLFYIFVMLAALFLPRALTAAAVVYILAMAIGAAANAPALPLAIRKGIIINFTVALVFLAILSITLTTIVDRTIRRIEESRRTEERHSILKALLAKGRGLAGKLAGLSEQLAAENQRLSRRTVEQAQALQQVAATIAQTTAQIHQNTENSQRAAGLAGETTRVAEQGVAMIDRAIAAIKDIDASGSRIAQITAVINSIAFQTNILALNAAIEAARAGTAGRGFAVVAGEVRSLSQRTSGAAKEIDDLIAASITNIRSGTDFVGKSGAVIAEILSSINDLRTMVEEIAEQSGEQRRGIDEIRQAIIQIDQAVQQNAAMVESTAGVSEELTVQVQGLHGMLEENAGEATPEPALDERRALPSS